MEKNENQGQITVSQIIFKEYSSWISRKYVTSTLSRRKGYIVFRSFWSITIRSFIMHPLLCGYLKCHFSRTISKFWEIFQGAENKGTVKTNTLLEVDCPLKTIPANKLHFPHRILIRDSVISLDTLIRYINVVGNTTLLIHHKHDSIYSIYVSVK